MSYLNFVCKILKRFQLLIMDRGVLISWKTLETKSFFSVSMLPGKDIRV
ncbi:MAG TPA: hypothetical protein GXX75_00410 [Clostridiales bacterium]|nr:hypothetical protein [Clostridiales bacterium]